MRIVAGAWRGRALAAPAGDVTRPTANRVRQALFDMIWHAPWAGRTSIEGATVLDAFAGTGALGLEALSRGATHATFFERDRAALASLRGNISACDAQALCTVAAIDATRPPPCRAARCGLVFLDPPYGRDLVVMAAGALARAGWIAPGALMVAEVARAEPLTLADATLIAERSHGPARLTVWRMADRSERI